MAVLNHPDTSNMDPTLARHWGVQVRKKATDPWQFVQGLTSVSSNIDKSRQDGGDIHGGNFTGQVATEGNWSLELGLQRKLADGVPDPGVELLRSLEGELGADELIHVRWWRTDDLPDSYQGRAGVTFKSAGGDKAALSAATVTLTGYQGYSKPAKPQAPETATSISVSPSDVTLDDGATLQLSVIDNNGADRSAEATYVSADPTVATVAASGVVTAVSAGDSLVTVNLGALSDTVAVTVA